MSGIRIKVLEWVDGRKRALVNNYRRLGFKASGQWEKDLESQTKFEFSKINIRFLGSAYTQQLTEGRGPNRDQSPEGLRAFVGWAGNTWLKDWVNRRGINASPFAIAWKIGREGIEVPNQNNPGTLVSDVLNINEVNKLVLGLGDAVIIGLKTDIKKI